MCITVCYTGDFTIDRWVVLTIMLSDVVCEDVGVYIVVIYDG